MAHLVIQAFLINLQFHVLFVKVRQNIQLRERLDSLAQNRKGDHFMKVKVNSDYFI